MTAQTAKVAPAPIRGAVLVVGPDGTGKSTVVAELTRVLSGMGAQVSRAHHQPKLSDAWSETSPMPEPQRQPPRAIPLPIGNFLSRGGQHAFAHRRAFADARTTGILLVERGWPDILIDPGRYGLPRQALPIVRAAGWFQPKYDVAIVLTGDPKKIHERKPEVPVGEIARQSHEWPRVAARVSKQMLTFDTTSQSPRAVAEAAVSSLSRGGLGRAIRVPFIPARVGLIASSGPRAKGALDLYRPNRRPAKFATTVSRALYGIGVGRATGWPGQLDALRYLPAVGWDALAVMKSSRPGRVIAALESDAVMTHVAKIGAIDDHALRREADSLAILGGGNREIRVPELAWAGEADQWFIVVTSAIAIGPKAPPPSLEQAASIASRLTSGSLGGLPVTHGDLAPWNIGFDEGVPVLLDWETAVFERRPLWDLAHYAVQAGALLGAWSPAELARQLTQAGGPAARHLADVGDDANLPLALIDVLGDLEGVLERESAAYAKQMITVIRSAIRRS